MTVRADFDVGPLSWVKGEIDHAIQRAQEALRAFAADSADAAQLKASQSHLHQAHGALSIVGLEGITRRIRGAGRPARRHRKGSFAQENRDFRAGRARPQRNSHLPRSADGGQLQPAAQAHPLYRDVVAARGGRADPTDLYFPDLAFRPPKRDKIPVPMKAADADKSLREQRGRYQRGLLKWLKNDASGAEDMRAAIETIEAAQGPARSGRCGGCHSPTSTRSRTRRCPRIPAPSSCANRIERRSNVWSKGRRASREN